MNLEIGKTYFLFCKFPDMSRFAMLDPHGYTTNRKIHAALFVVLDETRKERYESMIRTYHSDYPDAKFEFRSA